MVESVDDWVLVKEDDHNCFAVPATQKIWESLGAEHSTPLLEEQEEKEHGHTDQSTQLAGQQSAGSTPIVESHVEELKNSRRLVASTRKDVEELTIQLQEARQEARTQRVRAERAERRLEALTGLARSQNNTIRLLQNVGSSTTITVSPTMGRSGPLLPIRDSQEALESRCTSGLIRYQNSQKRSGQNVSLYQASKKHQQSQHQHSRRQKPKLMPKRYRTKSNESQQQSVT